MELKVLPVLPAHKAQPEQMAQPAPLVLPVLSALWAHKALLELTD
jgi:hypothetical protein